MEGDYIFNEIRLPVIVGIPLHRDGLETCFRNGRSAEFTGHGNAGDGDKLIVSAFDEPVVQIVKLHMQLSVNHADAAQFEVFMQGD